MSKFQFEGDFKRKPEQKFGGRSTIESRDAIILKAQAERNKRERDRLRAAAVLQIQAAARSFIIRQRCKNSWRNEFDRSLKVDLGLDGIGEQLKRINLFYNSKTDNDRLHELGKRILTHQESTLAALGKQVAWHIRMKRFISLCLEGVETSRIISRIFIRLIEVFTDVDNPNLHIIPVSEKNSFIPELWAELVGVRNFFDKWKALLETQLELQRDYVANPLPFADSLVAVLQKPLALARFLSTVQPFDITVDGRVIDSLDVSNLLMNRFVISFSSATFAKNDDPKNVLFFEFIVPKLKPSFPHQLLINNLVNLESADNQRQTFFTTIALLSDYIPSLAMEDNDLEKFMDAIQLYMKYIDIRYAPISKFPNITVDNDYDDEDMQVDEERDNFVSENVLIIEKLKGVFNRCRELENFFDQKDKSKWTNYCPIISRILNHYRQTAFGILNFLRNLSYRKTFVHSIYSRLQRQGLTNPDETVSFCWIFLNSIVSLHDSEFVTHCSLNISELENLIIMLKTFFAESVLNDRDEGDQANIFLNKSVVTVLSALHERNTRLQFIPEDSFCSHELSAVLPLDSHQIRFDDFDNNTVGLERLGLFEMKLKRILSDFPFLLNFHNRVTVIHRLISIDRAHRFMPYDFNAHHIQIRRNYIYEDAFEKLSVENVPDMRGNVRISLVNVVGVMEAGVDGGGLLREFLTEATKAGVDPNRGLFRLDSQNRLYPNPIAKHVVPDYRKHFTLIGRLVGKALYEQTLLELPLAAFFLESCIMGHVPGAVDYLATLDPALHKNLLALKSYNDEDFNSLGLDFTLTIDRLGDTHTVELKPNGSSISVSQGNVIEYIHLVADYKINRETAEICRFFREGLISVCPIPKLFTWRELQTLISGSDKPIDVEDWKSHTNYTGGYSDTHPMIQHFWEVVQGFEEKSLRKLLKFVTSCSRPPLLGFKDLVPNFGIQSAGQTDRLPSAATCMNLLKLPEYNNPLVLKEKLIYAIEAQAGFELS